MTTVLPPVEFESSALLSAVHAFEDPPTGAALIPRHNRTCSLIGACSGAPGRTRGPPVRQRRRARMVCGDVMLGGPPCQPFRQVLRPKGIKPIVEFVCSWA